MHPHNVSKMEEKDGGRTGKRHGDCESPASRFAPYRFHFREVRSRARRTSSGPGVCVHIYGTRKAVIRTRMSVHAEYFLFECEEFSLISFRI